MIIIPNKILCCMYFVTFLALTEYEQKMCLLLSKTIDCMQSWSVL